MTPCRNGMSDQDLIQLLLDKGQLTDTQLQEAVEGATKVAAGMRLSKGERDRWMAVAMAQKLTERTKIKPAKHKGAERINLGDPYSVRWTAGTDRAEEILRMAKTADGEMLTPPRMRR